MAVLPMTAVSISQKFEIEPRQGWREVPAMWILALLQSGERKSATFSMMVSPILEWERDQAVQLGPKIAEAAERRRVAEARLTNQRKKAAKVNKEDAETETESAVEMAKQLDQMAVVKAPTIYTSDATTEALAGMLVENQERALVASPEADALDVMMGRYSEKNSPNMGIWLKGHAGDSERVIRKSRPPEFLKRPVLSVAMVVQPESVSGMFASRVARGRGLLARFLASAPAGMLGRRKTGGAAQPIPPILTAKYRDALRYLLDLKIDPEEGPFIVRLDEEALELFHTFEAGVEAELGRGGCLCDRSDWGGKLCGAVARIALNLYVLQLAVEMTEAGAQGGGGSARCARSANEIDAATMRAALAWAPYLIDHEKIVAGVVGCDRETAVADRVLVWLEQTRLEAFSRREAFTANRSVHVQHVEDIDAPLALLAEFGYIRREPPPPAKPHGGRPASVRYQVNPLWNWGGRP